MSGPITWRNIQGRGVSDAARLLEGAGNSVNRGLAAFGQAISDQQQVRDENFANEQSNNTDTYFDRLAQFGSADELEQAEASGDLERLRQSLGPNIDRDAVRGAADSRLTELRAQESAALDRETRPLVDNIRAALVEDPESARASIESNRGILAEAGLYGQLLGEVDNRRQALSERDRSDSNRLRQERERVANEEFDAAVSEISRNTADPIQARRQVIERLENSGNFDLVQGRLSEVDQAIQNLYGLSARQMEDLSGFSGSVNAERDANVQRIQAELDNNETVFRNLDSFNAEVAQPSSLSDVVDYAGDLGWDRSPMWGKNLSKRITDTVSEFTDTVNQRLVQQAPEGQTPERIDPGLASAIAREAIGRIGAPGDGWFDNNDLGPNELAALMLDVYDEHTDRERRREQLNATRRRAEDLIRRYNDTATRSISDRLAQLRADNQAQLLR